MNTDLLVEAREALLNEAVVHFSTDPAVVGVFLSGSLPAGTADAYSDIDLRVVVTSDAHERFVGNRLEIPKQWKGFLFNEWMEGTQHCVSHFRPFGKIDIFYYSQTELRSSSWFSLPAQILYDPRGVIGGIIADSRPFVFKVEEAKVDWLISKGLAAAHEAYRRARRGELIYAQSLLEEFRTYLISADDWLHRRVPATSSDLKVENRLTPDLCKAITASYVSSDAREMEEALLRLLALYREQVIRLHETFNLSRPLENDLYAVDVLFE